MSNRLAGENSPYLLQHAENPVAWYPWGPEALAAARQEQKPIFLSIGYAACHWCHVMAHESFENPGIARLLSAAFISIKVDREERPDLDQVYMDAVQMLTGRGGWPMSVFLTPELEPFFGGTYWPPQAKGDLPGFDAVLRAVTDAWHSRRGEVLQQAHELTRRLRVCRLEDHDASVTFGPQPLQAVEEDLRRTFDRHAGGFGPAPKFPQPILLRLLLRRWRATGVADLLEMVRVTLDHMAAGGIYDHLGGGFHRYSVDGQWLVPHFEKMLYDNALLARAYLDAWKATGAGDYARVVGETLDYVLREMTDAEGGCYASEDADSPSGEGRFYLWTPAEVQAVLGATAARRFCYVYDVTETGNFEGRNILHRGLTWEQAARVLGVDRDELVAELDQARSELRAAREQRVRPLRDDKVLVAWNGLMIETLAEAGAALNRPDYVAAAARAADFVLSQVRADGRLLHYWRRGRAAIEAFLDDYAALLNALVSLYEAQAELRWIDTACVLADQMLGLFGDPKQGGFFYAAEHPQLLVRHHDVLDSSLPSATGLATTALLSLGRICTRNDYLAAAERTLHTHAAVLARAPAACGQMLLALDLYEHGLTTADARR
jgi:uncharacterized protein YyaL (SSP411 family)